ncbi:MAG: response regulator transcription factor [Acidobacteria bacterium]|nr:response regulator transcription factor [Acidobacteriota bacterium]
MRPVRILLVDDHEAVRRSIAALLRIHPDYQICGEACDAREAIEKAKRLLPHVVLLDISLPDMSGLEVLPQLRAHAPSCRILIVSQHDALHVRAEARARGAEEFVSKASLGSDLLPAIQSAVSESGEKPGRDERHEGRVCP